MYRLSLSAAALAVLVVSTPSNVKASVHSWDGVIYPALADDGSDTTYARAPLVVDSGFTCPVGDFSAHSSYPDSLCTDSSGRNIASWEILNVGSICGFSVYGCNENDGCSGAGCGEDAYIKIYHTDSAPDSNTVWTYDGTLTIEYNSCSSDNVNLYPNSEIWILVARSAHSGTWPDPRINEIDVTAVGSGYCL